MAGEDEHQRGAAVALAAEAVTLRLGATLALDQVSLAVPAGRCVALVGESGAGKTSLLRCFNRMVVPQSGLVTVGGEDVATLAPERLRRRIGYVPQQSGLLPHWPVLRNVALVPTLLRHQDPSAEAEAALVRVGLDPAAFGLRFPHQLSGGQRQRVALARAIAASPGLLLMDEPFGALDAITRADLQSAFAGLRRALGITTLLVTHDLREAELMADEVAVMRGGRIEQQAGLAALRAAPATPYVAKLLERAGLGMAA